MMIRRECVALGLANNKSVSMFLLSNLRDNQQMVGICSAIFPFFNRQAMLKLLAQS